MVKFSGIFTAATVSLTCREVSPVGTMDIEHLATSTTIEGAHSAVGRRGKHEVHPRIPISELKPRNIRDCDITVMVTRFSYRRPSQVTPQWHHAFPSPFSILFHTVYPHTYFSILFVFLDGSEPNCELSSSLPIVEEGSNHPREEDRGCRGRAAPGGSRVW